MTFGNMGHWVLCAVGTVRTGVFMWEQGFVAKYPGGHPSRISGACDAGQRFLYHASKYYQI